MRHAIDIGPLLARSMEAQAAQHGLAVTAEPVSATRWASVTFCGAHHTLRLSATAEAEQWLADLPESDFGLRRHLVADLAVDAIRHGDGRLEADIAVLVLETEG